MMRGNRTAVALGFLGALGLCTAGTAEAQIAPQARPAGGSMRANLSGQIQQARGSAGGPASLSQVDGTCRGYATAEPSHVIDLRQPAQTLTIGAVSDEIDATLLVMTPDGRIFCNDDADGRNPRVDLSSSAGPVRVWVGSYSSGRQGRYQLNVVAQGAMAPQHGAGGPQAGSGSSLYGDARLRAGFMPDPAILRGNAGGTIPASSIDGRCRGHITPQPTHVVQATTDFRQLRFVVSAGHDATLMVRLPDGRVLCDDDSGEGLNPLIETSSPRGDIQVWVGSYSSSASGPHLLGLTELGHVTANTLGRPSHVATAPTQPGGVVVTPPGQPGGVVVTPPGQPGGVVVAPPQGQAQTVALSPRIPVTIFGGGMTTTTLALWSPRGGPRVELSATPNGGSISVAARVDGRDVASASVPSEIATDAVVTVMERPQNQLLVRAERPPTGPRDPGASMLLLLRWNGRAIEIAERWQGTASERGPRWAR